LAFKKEDGWKMRLLFADNSMIAKCLYQAAFERISTMEPTGNYIVDKSYRNLGYGGTLFQAGVASLPKGCNFAADTFEEQVPMYESKFGYKRAWNNKRFGLQVSQASRVLSTFRCPTNFKVSLASDVPFRHLLEYDMSVQAHSRRSFLEKWISAPNSLSYIVTNDIGSVVGYTVVRLAFKKEDGWKMGPLFADNSMIAKCLYQAAFERISTMEPTGRATIDIPYGVKFHPDSIQIIRELGGKTEEVSVRMFSKRVPNNLPLHKVFGMTSPQIG
jgi:hypothetical protein